MFTEQVEVKAKKLVIEGSPFPYSYPESLEEALTADGEDKVYKLYIQQRKIRFMDSKRKEVTGGGIPKELIAALKNAPKEYLAKLLADLDIDLD